MFYEMEIVRSDHTITSPYLIIFFSEITWVLDSWSSLTDCVAGFSFFFFFRAYNASWDPEVLRNRVNKSLRLKGFNI